MDMKLVPLTIQSVLSGFIDSHSLVYVASLVNKLATRSLGEETVWFEGVGTLPLNFPRKEF